MNVSTVSCNGKATITTDYHVINMTKKSVHINGKEVKYPDGSPIISKTKNIMPFIATASFFIGFMCSNFLNSITTS
ncbi:MAG: hypothetical protein CL760_06355 [Chloroflexi bacterium]|nr:hypothetical protein [Chloroflexota bacterium]|tara:strand:- start:60515 stop:60742 length:228 start_codon:yes stop_codon:yes gene_type:complete